MIDSNVQRNAPDLSFYCGVYRLVMIGKELSKKFHPHVQTVTEGTDVIVTQIVT